MCDIVDRAAVEAARRACWSGIPRSTSSSTTPACLARGTFLEGRPRRDRAGDPRQLPRQRLVHARLDAGLRAAAAQTGGAHVVDMVSVARHGLVRAGRGVRSLEARPARVLPLARAPSAAPASPSTRSCPGSSRREGFPQKSVLKSRLMRRFVIEVERGRERGREGDREGQGGDDVPVVPLPARRDRAGGRAGCRRPLRRQSDYRERRTRRTRR